MLIVLVDVVLVEGLTDLTLGCNRGRSTPPLQTGLALPFGHHLRPRLPLGRPANDAA